MNVSNFSTLFEPNNTILTFLMIKTFFFIEVIGALALLRIFVAKGPSRLAALATVVIAFIGIAAKYVPPIAGISGTEVGRMASLILNQGVFKAGSGMALPVIVSLLFALSYRLQGRKWWRLDHLHLLCALGFFGLWVYTLI